MTKKLLLSLSVLVALNTGNSIEAGPKIRTALRTGWASSKIVVGCVLPAFGIWYLKTKQSIDFVDTAFSVSSLFIGAQLLESGVSDLEREFGLFAKLKKYFAKRKLAQQSTRNEQAKIAVVQ